MNLPGLKLLGENKRKNIILLAVIGGCLVGTIYFIFFYGKSAQPEIITDAASPVVASRESSVLPYGTTINTKILEQDFFRSLKPFLPLEILPEELGRVNLFSP